MSPKWLQLQFLMHLMVAAIVSAAPNASEDLTLREATRLVMAKNPRLAAATREISAADARILHAGLRPNPQVGVQVEDFAGGGEFRGLRESETTLELSQVIELGGKRAARLLEAKRGREVNRLEYETERLEVLKIAGDAFVDVLGGQERVALAEEFVQLAEKFGPILRKRAEAGKASALEEARNDAALASARLELDRAGRELSAARRRLAALWGDKEPMFHSVLGDLQKVAPPPPFPELLSGLKSHPSLLRWQAEQQKRHATVAKERSNAAPDLTISLGPRWHNGPDSAAMVGGFSLPLPLWNRNQGAIREAEVLAKKAGDERAAEESKLVSALGDAFEQLARSHREASILQDQVIPPAQKAYSAAQEGYDVGRFSQLELLEARRAVIDARKQRLQALVDYHQAAITIETMTGKGLKELKK